MAQFFSALFFTAVAAAAGVLVAAMLRDAWARILSILSGAAYEQARVHANPAVRVRMRAWRLSEAYQARPPLRAAA